MWAVPGQKWGCYSYVVIDVDGVRTEMGVLQLLCGSYR